MTNQFTNKTALSNASLSEEKAVGIPTNNTAAKVSITYNNILVSSDW